ncbi:unnamed protein product [Pedinophyceae sp. YPF-701]|nr:unnamed protein product [Pedinophyceae sp. YPF-701]
MEGAFARPTMRTTTLTRRVGDAKFRRRNTLRYGVCAAIALVLLTYLAIGRRPAWFGETGNGSTHTGASAVQEGSVAATDASGSLEGRYPWAAGRVAACITGQLRTFVFRAVFNDLYDNVLAPLRADTFAVINLDLHKYRSPALMRKDLELAFELIEPITYVVLDPPPEVSGPANSPDCIGGGEGPVRYNCPLKVWQEGGWFRGGRYVASGRAHASYIQFAHVQQCHGLVERHEESIGFKYGIVFRLRTDIRVSMDAQLAAEGRLGTRLAEAALRGVRLGLSSAGAGLPTPTPPSAAREACLVSEADEGSHTVSDWFAVCSRGGFAAYAGVADVLRGEAWMQLGACAWHTPEAPECKLRRWLDREAVAVEAAGKGFSFQWTRLCADPRDPAMHDAMSKRCLDNETYMKDTAARLGVALPDA